MDDVVVVVVVEVYLTSHHKQAISPPDVAAATANPPVSGVNATRLAAFAQTAILRRRIIAEIEPQHPAPSRQLGRLVQVAVLKLLREPTDVQMIR